MATLDASYLDLVANLTDRYGKSGVTTPSEPSFESVVRAFLDANTSKSDQAFEMLREVGWTLPVPLANADPAEVSRILRASKVNLKPSTLAALQKLAHWATDLTDENGQLNFDLNHPSTEELRDQLRRLRGIGPATADTILLLGLSRAAYPVDRASYRILVRHGWLDSTAEYDEARALLEHLDPDEPQRLAQLSRWFESIGSEYCRASVPRCDHCPLRPFLPDGGPLEPDA